MCGVGLLNELVSEMIRVSDFGVIDRVSVRVRANVVVVIDKIIVRV